MIKRDRRGHSYCCFPVKPKGKLCCCDADEKICAILVVNVRAVSLSNQRENCFVAMRMKNIVRFISETIFACCCMSPWKQWESDNLSKCFLHFISFTAEMLKKLSL